MAFGDVFLPSAPLVPYLRHRELVTGSRQLLAVRYHNALGITENSAERLFGRIVTGEYEKVSLRTADRICTALGLHVNLVYGREVYEQGLEEVGEEAVTAMS